MSDSELSPPISGSATRHGSPAGELAAAVDARRKAGELTAAGALIEAHGGRHEGSPLIWIAAARLALTSGDRERALTSLRRAHQIAPEHPWVSELLTRLGDAPIVIPAAEAITEALPERDTGSLVEADSAGPEPDFGPHEHEDEEELVSPSLAELYRSQGHPDQALAVYTRLARRNPDDHSIAARRDELEAEIAASAPVPFDSRSSGGPSVADRMDRLSAGRPELPGTRPESYDSFYLSQRADEAGADYDAFRRWLEELER